MTHINELIDRLAPAGVPYQRIGDVAQVGTGSSDRKDAVLDGEYPFYVRSKDVMRINSFEFDEDAILIPGEGGIGEIFHVVSGKYALHQRAYRISFLSEGIDTRFAYYYFSVHFKQFILRKALSATVTSIRKPMITDFRIPVPPITVQREIVRILDNFTRLEGGLEAELLAERVALHRRYTWHRDFLLGSIKGTRIPLGELGQFMRGRRFTKSDVVKSGIPSIHYGEIYTEYGSFASRAVREIDSDLVARLRFAQPNDVIFAGVGETVADVGKAVAWLGDEPVAVHDDTFAFTSELNPRFVAYAVQATDFQIQKENHVARGKVKRLSLVGLAKIEIPVPNAREQARLVSILDQYEALVKDLTVGLQAEITARRKQYDYYRNKLLVFEEAAA